MKRLATIGLVGLAWLSYFSAVPASAANGFTVTPAFQSATVDKTPTTSLTIEIQNSTKSDQSFSLSVADFGSLNESGGVAFLGTAANELDRPYGLVSWLSLDHNVIFIPAGATVPIGITVENRDSLAPGGHYGAILATAITDTGQPKSVSTQIGLHQVLSSLILLTKTGGAEATLKLVSETSNRSPLQLPSTLVQRFQNPGNVHVVPRGTVAVKDPAGRVVATGALNENSYFILPESFRRIPVDLMKTGHAWLPGRYTITTSYRFDGTDTLQTFSDTVWYAGQLAVWVAWAILALGTLSGGWWLRRRYRRNR